MVAGDRETGLTGSSGRSSHSPMDAAVLLVRLIMETGILPVVTASNGLRPVIGDGGATLGRDSALENVLEGVVVLFTSASKS